jgi:putative ABC transport system substrate-binding protein
MKRRELLLFLAGAMTAAPALRAQQKAMPVIGYLATGSPGPTAPNVVAFRQGLSETGYVEGKNVTIEYRGAEGQYDRLPALAADLVGRKIDVIVATSVPSARAAKTATSTIPIVFAVGTDPVEDGLVASLARPGGNLTGVTFMMTELMQKRLELLSELAQQVGVIALLVNPDNPNVERTMARRAGSGAGEGGPAPDPKGRYQSRDRRRVRRLRPAARRRASGGQRPILLQPTRAARRTGITACRSGDL